jgi:hypothetical protein
VQNSKPDPKEPRSLKEGLIAYYPFTGNANDRSGFGVNGVVMGTILTTDRWFNEQNQAYLLNGFSDYITIPDNNKNDLATEYSISVGFTYTQDMDWG